METGRSAQSSELSCLVATPFEVPVLGPESFCLASLRRVSLCLAVALSFLAVHAWAAVGGSISGTVADKSGAVVEGAILKLVNTAQQTIYQTISDKQGLYSFPNLPVGHYDLTTTATGFTPSARTALQ